MFSGTPLCGACRALKRIHSLLRSGHLKGDQERRVAEIVRGAAGELTDLVEENLSQGRADLPRAAKEETPGLPSGPKKAPDAEAGEKGESDYTEESSEEELIKEDDPGTSGVTEVKEETAEAEDKAREVAAAAPEGRSANNGEDQGTEEYPRELELRPVPKASNRGDRGRGLLTPRTPDREPHREETSPRGSRTPARRGPGARPGGQEEDSEGRPPLVRRPVKRQRSRERGNQRRKAPRESA